MIVLLCRNRVVDFSKWKAFFDSQASDVFFVFEVASLDKARAFIDDPRAAEAGKTSGVLDGEYRFLESTPGC